jgi:transposase
VPAAATIEIDTADGHRLRINGAYDPEALARLIRGLSR